MCYVCREKRAARIAGDERLDRRATDDEREASERRTMSGTRANDKRRNKKRTRGSSGNAERRITPHPLAYYVRACVRSSACLNDGDDT